MHITYWVLAGLLAIAYLMAGAMKSTRSKPQLVDAGIVWAGDFPIAAVRFIGIVELLGAIGLILPPIVDVAPVLGSVAAIGLALVQVGAVATHLIRHEAKVLPMNVVLLALAAATAVVGFNVWR